MSLNKEILGGKNQLITKIYAGNPTNSVLLFLNCMGVFVYWKYKVLVTDVIPVARTQYALEMEVINHTKDKNVGICCYIYYMRTLCHWFYVFLVLLLPMSC